MNKRNLLLLAIVTAIGLSACSKKQSDAPATANSSGDTGSSSSDASSDVLPDAPIEDKSAVVVDVSAKEQGDHSIGDAAVQAEKELEEALAKESLPEPEEVLPEEQLPDYHPDSETTAAEVGVEATAVEEGEAIDPEAKIPVSEQY